MEKDSHIHTCDDSFDVPEFLDFTGRISWLALSFRRALLKFFGCILIILFIANYGFSQQSEYHLLATASIPVLGLQGDTLSYPFAGGMNNCQYGSIDLNMDGVKDLLVFDRHGDRLLTFINNNLPGTISYTYAPDYTAGFPAVSHWIQLIDYNQDGKEDIFTYTTGGIKVFRNDSESGLKFTQVSRPYLVSLQGSTLTNILVTYADYPAICDIDQDGDMDILTFWGLGAFVEWHRNLSMEKYGIADSLEFQRTSRCWGQFAEGVESNVIQLDTCPDFGLKNEGNDTKHTGSTLLAHDFTGDGLPDLLLGDVDFPSLVYLKNGGTLDTALMISQTTAFPGPINPVNITSFPAACLVDVNNDGLQDLLVSPFDPGLLKSQGAHCSWLYTRSDNGSGAEVYDFLRDDFLQGEMIDLGFGAYPLLLDENGDGRLDLLAGNVGKLDSVSFSPVTGLQCFYSSSLALFRNTGSSEHPAFRLITTDYLGLSSLKMQSLIPCAGDVDGDGDQDLICGNSKGKLVYYENTAGPGQPCSFVLRDPAYKNIDVGDYSAPQVVDLNSDGLNDLVIGQRNGRLSYFQNQGPLNDPQFVFVTDSLGGVDVTNTEMSYYGYSTPFFTKSSHDSLILLVGSEFGDIFAFKGIESGIQSKFQAAGVLTGVKVGWRSGLAMGYLDNDTIPEIFVGNYSGGISLFEGIQLGPLSEDEDSPVQDYGHWFHPNPASSILIIDHLTDAGNQEGLFIIRSLDGRLVKSGKMPESREVDIKDISPGIYLLTFVCAHFTLTSKLLICR